MSPCRGRKAHCLVNAYFPPNIGPIVQTGLSWGLRFSMAELAFSDLSYHLYNKYLCPNQYSYVIVLFILSRHVSESSFKTAVYALVTMLIKVKTLTRKEIEIDIDQTDKVERIKVIPPDPSFVTPLTLYLHYPIVNPFLACPLSNLSGSLLLLVQTFPYQERVEEKEGIPPQQQRLIFSGKQMNDEKVASDYKVSDW